MKKVLVIDDEEIICLTIKQGLEETGEFEVFIAHTGLDGVELAEDIKPDVILLDVDLGQESGLALTELGKMFNVIIISGKVSLSTDFVRKHLRAYCFMEKPFKFKELIETINFVTNKENALTEKNMLEALCNFFTLRLWYDLLRWNTGIFFTPEDMARAMEEKLFTKEARAISQDIEKEFPPYDTVEGLPIGAYKEWYRKRGDFAEYFRRVDEKEEKK